MNKTGISPVPPKKQIANSREMAFFKALEEVVNGHKITKLEWDDPLYYGVLRDGQLCLHKPDGKFYQWIISEGDLIGEDFVILNNPD